MRVALAGRGNTSRRSSRRRERPLRLMAIHHVLHQIFSFISDVAKWAAFYVCFTRPSAFPFRVDSGPAYWFDGLHSASGMTHSLTHALAQHDLCASYAYTRFDPMVLVVQTMMMMSRPSFLTKQKKILVESKIIGPQIFVFVVRRDFFSFCIKKRRCLVVPKLRL